MSTRCCGERLRPPAMLRPDPAENTGRFVARLLVVLLCAVALLQAARPTVYSARQGYRLLDAGADPRDPARILREQMEYVRAELGRQVPENGRILTTGVDPAWTQRLVEFATMNGLRVATAPES